MDANSLGELTRAAISEGQREHQIMLDEQERERRAAEEAMSKEAWAILDTVPERARQAAKAGKTSALITYLTASDFEWGLEPKIQPDTRLWNPKLTGVANLVFRECFDGKLNPFVSRGADSVYFIAISVDQPINE